jgi:tetratricopeptide (TPR) repeat protein
MPALWEQSMFGFGFNKDKSRANAERYLQQNKLQNAISEYEKILQVEPRDLAILNTVGDIYSRLGQNDKAIERFRVIGESYANDGSILKSIAMYKKITKLDPNGLPAMEKLAELYRKQGLVSDARSMLLQAADAYTRKGQSKETLRLLKQLVLFDPENVQVLTRTADLMVKGGQKNEAKEMLSQTAATLVQRHALDPAQKILERLISLDRTDLRAQELRAQVTFALGDAAKAAELYEAIPDLDSRIDGLRNLLDAYLKLENLDAAILVCRKLISQHHDADGVLKVAAHLYEKNDTLRALALYNDFSADVLARDKEDVMAHLHGAVSRVRTNPEALQTLYKLFQYAGETSMIAEVLELLAHASVQNNQFETARDAYKELIELEPENASHVQGYRQVCARINPASVSTPVAVPKVEDEPRTLEEFLTTNEPDLPLQNYPAPIEEVIANALTEAELCESFSSKTRGIAALEAALGSAPDDLRLNRTLALLYTQQGESSKAVRCYSILQRVLEELGENEAAGYYANLAGAQQTHTWEAKGSEFTARDFDLNAVSDEASGSTEEIDLSGEWESVWQDTPATPAANLKAAPELPPPPPAADTALPSENVPEQLESELLEEVRFCLAQQIWPEAETAIARLATACPEHPELPALRAQLQQGCPVSTPAEPPIAAPSSPAPVYAPVEVIEVSDDLSTISIHASSAPSAPSTPPFPAAPVATPTLNSLAAELDAELGDSFVPVSKPQPRREIPAPALGSAAPDSPTPAPVPMPPLLLQAAPVEAPVEFVFDESETNFVFDESDPFDTPPTAPPEPVPDATVVEIPSIFGNLLQDFEDGLTAPQKDANDPETLFNLGIAFREMGLLDEAIGELQKVCRMAASGKVLSPSKAQQAYIWLATCFVEKSVPEASFNWFLLAMEGATDEESRTAITYELASAYQAAGLKREAYDRFMEVYRNNIDYRDVASRISELRIAI